MQDSEDPGHCEVGGKRDVSDVKFCGSSEYKMNLKMARFLYTLDWVWRHTKSLERARVTRWGMVTLRASSAEGILFPKKVRCTPRNSSINFVVTAANLLGAFSCAY